MAKWDRIHAIRDDVNKSLETARAAKVIGKSLEAEVELHCDGELYDFASSVQEMLPDVFIVSKVDLVKDTAGKDTGVVEGLSVTVKVAGGAKCERCWVHSDTVGQNPAHPTLCARCAAIVEE